MSYRVWCSDCRWHKRRKKPEDALYARAVHAAYEHHDVSMTRL